MAVPDSSKRLSDGLVIETSVLARLFGFKLLTLQGTVLVSPAQLRELSMPSDERPAGAASQCAAGDDVPVPPRETGQGASPRLRPHGAHGARLGLAKRLLSESADELRGLE